MARQRISKLQENWQLLMLDPAHFLLTTTWEVRLLV